MPIHPADVSALIFRINVVGISRVDEGVKAIAVEDIFPARVGNAARVLRVADPTTVVLQTAINPIRISVVNAHVVKLGNWQVIALPPFGTAIVGIPNAAIIPGDDSLRIGRINPHIVHVAVCASEAADHRKALAAVFAENQRAIGLEHAIGIFRVDDQVRKIKRTPNHPVALVPLCPGLSTIVGNVESAVW